jgi:hypothetical protein
LFRLVSIFLSQSLPAGMGQEASRTARAAAGIPLRAAALLRSWEGRCPPKKAIKGRINRGAILFDISITSVRYYRYILHKKQEIIQKSAADTGKNLPEFHEVKLPRRKPKAGRRPAVIHPGVFAEQNSAKSKPRSGFEKAKAFGFRPRKG